MKSIILFTILLTAGLSSCKLFNLENGKTLGEQNSTYSYIPIDPLSVSDRPGRSCCKEPEGILSGNSCDCTGNYKELLDAFPDQAVRLAMRQTNGNISGGFSPVAIAGKGESYQVILDYIMADVSRMPVRVSKYNSKKEEVSIYEKEESSEMYSYFIERMKDDSALMSKEKEKIKDGLLRSEILYIPVVIGVGLRVTANLITREGKVELSGLSAISASAEAGELTGTLTVQTLGITGIKVSAALPLPSELNQTTIQNAILSIGSIKALLDKENDDLVIEPRVLGFYNPIGGGNLVNNKIIAAMAEDAIEWKRPCTPK